MSENTKHDLATKYAYELSKQFDNLTTIFSAIHDGVTYAVPILAAFEIIDKYAKESGSNFNEIMRRILYGIKNNEKTILK